MKIKVKDQSQRNNSELLEMIKGFVPYTQNKLGYSKPFSLNLVSDAENAADSFGKTAFYNPEDFSITLFVDNRHNKDILRSLSHEIIHHSQNCSGKYPDSHNADEGYAQKDPELRNLEAEAYLLGNGLMFRDYEDSLKENKQMDKKKVKLGKEQIKHVLREVLKRVAAAKKAQNKKKSKKVIKESVEVSEKTEPQVEENLIVETDTAVRRVLEVRNERRFRNLMKRWSK